MGAPKIYSDKIKGKLLSQLAEGKSLRAICTGKGMPSPSTVCTWVAEDDAFAQQYTRAREIGYLLLAEELLAIADDGSNDTYKDDNGNERTNYDVVQRSRLRVDTRKWMLAKMLPRVFGEKVTQEHTGKDGGHIEVAVTHTIVDPSADTP